LHFNPSEEGITKMSGRGGAGNILAQQQALERVAADVEAAIPKQVTSVGPADLPNSPRENQPYAYTGRGMSFIIKKKGIHHVHNT
jgi:hypothetical protein